MLKFIIEPITERLFKAIAAKLPLQKLGLTPSTLTLILLILFGTLYYRGERILSFFGALQLGTLWWAMLSGYLLLTCLVLLTWLIALLCQHEAFGIYWSFLQKPHCPCCRTLLSHYSDWPFHGWAFQCLKCDKIVTLRDDHGKHLTLIEAKERLQKKATQKALPL
ncbi:MAG: hypothetical protein HZA08_04970 [Nitrospirae bacterium]|nr:hypothetical protein [Nitrospirota bacterium]